MPGLTSLVLVMNGDRNYNDPLFFYDICVLHGEACFLLPLIIFKIFYIKYQGIRGLRRRCKNEHVSS